MAKAKQGDTVQTHYTGKLDDGTIFDTSDGNEPLQFTIGSGQVISGYEQGVIGMGPGQSKQIRIPAEEAYGLRRGDMILAVSRTEFPPEIDPQVGDKFEMRQADGAAVVATVIETAEESVTLDANHPLAGCDLIFDVELLAIV